MGYGNLGRGVELAVRQNPDMELAAFFTRRDPSTLKTLSPEVPVYNVKDAVSNKDEVDVAKIVGTSDMKKVKDMRGNPLLLFINAWSVGMTLDRNDGLVLSEFGHE